MHAPSTVFSTTQLVLEFHICGTGKELICINQASQLMCSSYLRYVCTFINVIHFCQYVFLLALNQLKRQKRMFFVEMFANTTKSQYLCIVKRLIDCLG